MITAGAIDAGECADAEPPRASGAERAIRGYAPIVRIPQPQKVYALAKAAAEARGSRIPWPYHAYPVPTAGDSDLRMFGAHFQELMRAHHYSSSAQELIMLAGTLEPETVGGFVVNAVDRPVEIQVKSQVSKRRRRVRGYHRRPSPAARMYSRLGLIVRLGHSPQSLTGAAVLIAGKKRSAMHDEWRSHLAGWTGRGLAREDQIRAARGFLWSAVRYRLSDAASLVGRGTDVMLRSRNMSNLTVWIPVFLAMLAIVRHNGLYGLITYDLNLIELGGGIYGAIRYGRRRRGVKPTKRKPGQVSTK